ncbi:glycogen-binding subunit 76A-like [Argiope bruennichi]|uniref:glycogen-binding subunit 76A-like n=1 Tax=Argiope bruennichi TaxID=94029 RepID=UPI002495914C|nr:glycogen-binding subunit 76A-like [Argiope bruennichi]
MLKRKRMITTCSLSSCRIKAEALARVFNSRIWPCTWVDRRRAEDSAEEDEEYFEASPIEDENEQRGRDSSAATVEGRAKLYELLQQHANDDATEVFYDVSDHVESDAGNVSQSVVEENGFEEIELRDSHAGISEINATGDVISSGELVRNGECKIMPIDSASENSSAAVVKRSYFDDSEFDGVIREEPKTSSFEKEVLAGTWDSGSLGPNRIEIYPKYLNGFLNDENINKEIEVSQDTNDTFIDNDKQETDINLNKEQTDLISVTEKEKYNAFDFENEEILTVSIDSGSCTINQTEVHDDKAINALNKANIVSDQNGSQIFDTTNDQETESESQNIDTTIENDTEIDFRNFDATIEKESGIDSCNFDTTIEKETESDSRNSDTTTEKEIEIDTKGSENSISIEVISSSPPGKDRETNSNENISKVDTDIQENCRLHVFAGARPAISRSTSLKTGKTPPGTPSRKKIVRFADVLGLDLEDVRHIISGDLPNVPSSAFSDLVLPDEDLPTKCTPSATLELTGIPQGSWENIQQGAVGLNTIYPLFDIPGQQHDFIDRVRNNGICLENVIISDFNVQCTCRVMNWGFTKKVIARYSMDNWNSSQDINASYVSDSSRDGMDSFAFNIFLSQQRRNVEFALCYTVNGRDYWDNNSGKNYCLGYHSNDSIGNSSVPTSPTWIHQF